MFQQKNGHSATHGASDAMTFLGPGTEFIGKVLFNGTLRVDGAVEGEIEGKDALVIGDNGKVKGQCRVKSAIISGTFDGQIEASEKVILKNCANVFGKLSTHALVIEEGARFNGSCEMPDASKRGIFDGIQENS